MITSEPIVHDQKNKRTAAERQAAVESDVITLENIVGSTRKQTIQQRLDHYKISGASIAVILDGEIDWAEGYGVVKPGTLT